VSNPIGGWAASAKLTHAIVLSFQGDWESACEEAERAGVEAAEAGWMKGEALAAGNLAFFHVSAGHIKAAEECLTRVDRIGYITPSYSYAVRDTRMALAVAMQDYSESDRLWEEGQERLRGVASWYKLYACHTRVRTLIRQARIAEALSLAEECKKEAGDYGSDYFKYAFELSIAEIQAAQGVTARSSIGAMVAGRVIAKPNRGLGDVCSLGRWPAPISPGPSWRRKPQRAFWRLPVRH
jgi:ATP/maltotriose-dependent transcriptional regulator MalT